MGPLGTPATHWHKEWHKEEGNHLLRVMDDPAYLTGRTLAFVRGRPINFERLPLPPLYRIALRAPGQQENSALLVH